MLVIMISVAVFLCVATLVGGVALMLRGNADSTVEDRLQTLAGRKSPGKQASADSQLLSGALDRDKSFLDDFATRFLDLQKFLDQAGASIEPSRFLLVVGLLGLGGAGICIALPMVPIVLVPFAALTLASFPFLWLFMKRKRRLSRFAKQLPEALELISRALRAGHSLASGIGLVASEMDEPIGPEFTRCFEEQNLGIPMEDALESLTDRVPNLDLRFFVTAVILQRQTGGDLAEILDKIGRLIRERFTIWGQIQALTGEGRLSGIVLLALPPLLFLALLKLNYDYVMMLFEDPLGQKMLVVAVVMQLIGAYVIKKIVNIQV